MLAASALKSMKVMFATPCYISAVSMNYVASIFSLTYDAMHLGLDCILHLHSESLITRGRNNIVRKFLAEESFTRICSGSIPISRLVLTQRSACCAPIATSPPASIR
jgi:hypothetical protein